MTSARRLPREADPQSSPAAPARGTQQDDAVDFSELVQAHLDFIWRLLRRLGLSPADAEDAAQQVFIVAESKRELIEPGKERTFLYGTALRVAANARRSLRSRREVSAELASGEQSTGPQPDRSLELSRAHSLLDELLLELPEDLARVLLLAEMEGHTVPAIAELEGIPAGTAASRLRRARELFRELLVREQHRNPFRGAP